MARQKIILRIFIQNTKYRLFMGLVELTKNIYIEIRNKSYTKYAILVVVE